MSSPCKTLIRLLLTSCSGGNGGGQLEPPPPPAGPPAVQTQQVFDMVNLSFVTALQQAPADPSRWFAAEKAGRIVVFDNDTANATGSIFLDISARAGLEVAW